MGKIDLRPKTLVWFRQDLRVQDHPALFAACERGHVVPVYIWDPEDGGDWPLGAASRWWLHHSLESLGSELKQLGMDLVIRMGPAANVIAGLIKETGADAVYWSLSYEPAAIARDAAIMSQLTIEVKSFNSSLLFEPWTIANKQGKPFQVFTPFWKTCLSNQTFPSSFKKPSPAKEEGPKYPSASINDLGLLPKKQWDEGLKAFWKPGASSAKKKLEAFLKNGLMVYGESRDFPSVDGVSMMSPHLHFGEISPRMIWEAVRSKYADDPRAAIYLRQLGWREFAHYLLYHFPNTPLEPLRADFRSFPWRNDKIQLHAWQKGMTGYPFVDAGMRQLWKTGWMHNRVRMVVGSFLVKDLRISWLEGARWFWDTLVDADLANNTLGWQWVGGCGADAAPYFRIFNPITQGEKFDVEGAYVREWVPELARLPNKWIHRPWEAPSSILKEAGIILGKDYPYPIVDHNEARVLALNAFKHRSEY